MTSVATAEMVTITKDELYEMVADAVNKAVNAYRKSVQPSEVQEDKFRGDLDKHFQVTEDQFVEFEDRVDALESKVKALTI